MVIIFRDNGNKKGHLYLESERDNWISTAHNEKRLLRKCEFHLTDWSQEGQRKVAVECCGEPWLLTL